MKSIRQLDSRLKIHAAFALLYAVFAAQMLLAAPEGSSPLRAALMLPLAAGLGLTVALSLWLARDATRPLQDAAQMAHRLLDGDLRVRADNPQPGAAGRSENP